MPNAITEAKNKSFVCKYISKATKDKMVSLFISRLLSSSSHDRLIWYFSAFHVAFSKTRIFWTMTNSQALHCDQWHWQQQVYTWFFWFKSKMSIMQVILTGKSIKILGKQKVTHRFVRDSNSGLQLKTLHFR